MNEGYHVPLTDFSVDERKRYQEGIKLIASRQGEQVKRGLEQVFNVLGNAKPIIPERSLAFVRDLLGAYKNLGKAMKNCDFCDADSILGDLYARNRDVLGKYFIDEAGKDLDVESVSKGIDSCLGEYGKILVLMDRLKVANAEGLAEKINEYKKAEEERDDFQHIAREILD